MSAEIASRLEILEGAPERGAIEYRRHIVHAFVNHGTKILARRMLLCLLPNGDWCAPMLQHYISPNTPDAARSRDFIVTQMCTGLMVVFSSRSPSLYDRSRWTGAEMAIDDLAIMESCHIILSTSFARFAYSQEKGGLTAERLLIVHSLRE